MGNPSSSSITTQTWRYKGVSADGTQLQRGTIEATTEEQALARISKLNIIPMEVVNASAGTGLNKNIDFAFLQRYPKKKDFAVMARQLATMVGAGVALARAVDVISQQTENAKLRKALQSSLSLIESGHSFSDAMKENSDVFPPIMIFMVQAGETGGFLDTALITIADSFEADVKLQSQIKSAMAYPVVVLCIAFILVGVMLLTIVPTFSSMYTSMGAKLPAVTEVLVVLGKGAPIVFPLLIIGIIAFAVFWRKNHNKDQIRSWWDPFKLRAPVFGKLNTCVALARFCRNFSSMLSSGVPILQALDIVGSTSGNYVIETAAKRIGSGVEKGRRLSDSMAAEKVFPDMLKQMVAIGEDSGSIDHMLDSAGKAYDEEATTMAKQLTSLLEPLMILVLGGIVGFMVVALYMPMFSIFNAVNNMS